MKYLRIFTFVSLMFFIGCENITESPVSEATPTETANFSKVTLPDGAVVESASMQLFVTAAGGYTVDIHPVLESWNELQVTWNSRETGTPWSTPGGHIDPLFTSFQVNNLGWTSVNITALVNDWLNGTENNGILLKAQNDFDRTYFWSSDYSDPILRPRLVLSLNNSGLISNVIIVQRDTEGNVFDSFIDQTGPDATQWDLSGSFDELLAYIKNGAEKRSLILFDIDQKNIPGGPGTGTPGYWKTHPDAWPVQQIVIGGVLYSKDDAIDLMNSPVKKDKTFNLFMHLVSAKLNLEIGNDGSCISEDIDLADTWMANNGPVGSGVAAKTSAWQDISDVFTSLDEYNNGWLCATHRD